MIRLVIFLIPVVMLFELWQRPLGPLVVILIIALGIWAGVVDQRRKAGRSRRAPPLRSVNRSRSPPPSQSARPETAKVQELRMTASRGTDCGTDLGLELVGLVHPSILNRSGSVFYSGRSAFAVPSDLYVLGLNPGGSPIAQSKETVGLDLADWQHNVPTRWSAYADESWEAKPPGTCGMQPRVLHLFDRLGRDPRDVPASNVVFVRSTTEATLQAEKASLLKLCWPVHDAVISHLGAKTILCFGGTAAGWVRDIVGAKTLVGSFREQNNRGWTSEAYLSAENVCVIQVTHPSRANWRNPASDPTPLVLEMLAR